MKLSEFVLQRRGPYLFDHYIHPVKIHSPVGEFSLQFHVNDAAKRPPDETDQKMLEAMEALYAAFKSDTASLVSLIHAQYLLATEDEEWIEMLGIPAGLSVDDLEPLLDARTLTVSQDEIDNQEPHPGRVCMSPEWDPEHGLYFARVDNSWVQEDC